MCKHCVSFLPQLIVVKNVWFFLEFLFHLFIRCKRVVTIELNEKLLFGRIRILVRMTIKELNLLLLLRDSLRCTEKSFSGVESLSVLLDLEDWFIS